MIIYSDLSTSNGGVETWFMQFAKEWDSRDKENTGISHINIFHIDKQNDAVKWSKGKRLLYHPITVSDSGNLLQNFRVYYNFHRAAWKMIWDEKSSKKVILSVGSYPTGIFIQLLIFFSGKKSSILHVIWLRTTLKHFLKTLRVKSLEVLILWIEKWSLNRAQLVISNGWDTQSNYSNITSNNLVIPNAIDLKRYQYRKKLKNDDSVRPYRIAFIGRFFKNKGIDNFIKAIEIYNRVYPECVNRVEFCFVGWGPAYVIDFINSVSNCKYFGRLENHEIPNFLMNVDCGVALTLSEDSINGGGSGVSNGLLELFASRTLVIAYQNSIYTQFKSNNLMIMLTEGDNHELAYYFRQLITKNSLYTEYVNNAYNFVKKMDITNHVDTVEEMLNNSISSF